MSYMALYRKWRPDVFQEVKGQEHIVTTLKNQIIHKRVGHAYLFCGTRGTGKTTIAKLMAKAVNCDNPIDGSPCNECESCKAIAAGNSMNVIEIDAASNNGVDNMRQINNSVQYSPQNGKYLVYIIDEAHMITSSAFNALLKTLEEPPEYVIFILATTEYHKIPITILSRCQRYDFRRISIETIGDRLCDLLERENIKATREAVDYVAKAADGSMRDALSILEQCISFNLGEELTYDRVLNAIGAVDIDIYIELLKAVRDEDIAKAMEIVDSTVWQGKDLVQFTNEFAAFVRNVLMLKLDPELTVDVTSEKKSLLIELGRDYTENCLLGYINILQAAADKINYATAKRIILEVTVIKMCKHEMQSGTDFLEQRIEAIEKKLDSLNQGERVVYVKQETPEGETEQTQKHPVEETDNVESDKVLKNIQEKYRLPDADEVKSIARNWNILKKSGLRIRQRFLANTKLIAGEQLGDFILYVVDEPGDCLTAEYFRDQENVSDIKNRLQELTGREINLVCQVVSKKDFGKSDAPLYDFGSINFDINYED